MKVTVDTDICIGAGNCETTAPAVFTVKDGKSLVKVDTVPEDQEDKAKQAAEECPSGAISIS
ncbi:MAG: ferredoxin [Desulfobulbaceae bacterium]|nr:ferredoxin [Desulfobulbaceae bacterium]